MCNCEALLRDIQNLQKAFIEGAGFDIKGEAEYTRRPDPRFEGGFEKIPTGGTNFKVTKRPKKEKKAQSVTNNYTVDFNGLWLIYPSRVGSNSKQDAFRAFNARLNEGVFFDAMMTGVIKYNAFLKATDALNTKYVLQAATFFGKSEHYLNKWEVTKEMTAIKLPTNNDDLPAFAAKHKLRGANKGELWPAYRKYLQDQVEQLNKG